ncbi:chaperone modulator CbpM [Streptomyces sp. NBC_01340]|uniref:chaperone modulator CbpM n=1 Tax=unclassified Streptomyces TaxID=2593676 RepID=UPI00224FC72B|nr:MULTISPECIES: chaperone modulator CbpM [unclassified Streptomyces]MCX4457949.1 chaperone modulator CbpM [Streptomyces sp. NBC_01719]MCX4497306.1 chaperone modulator CbpM [Streptomyces sp. NBC_01728]MCX4596636.1 chaperone modulator CbpM [Streptomyces sp. NBC_01549]WSI42156.1 chaperone modulator CbpM [Streptomyces sp. NBC_01340]
MNDRPAGAAGIGRAGVGNRPVRTGADLTASSAVRYPLVPAPRLSLNAVARRSGLHPDLIRRFVALGLIDTERDAAGRLVFGPTAPAVLARIQRLRTGLCLNYASIGLVLDLLDRISLLEAALRGRGMRSETPPWT